MRLPVLGLLLMTATACATGPYSLEAQLNRRLGNIRKHLAPESLPGTVSRRVSNLGRTAGVMVQVPTRLEDLSGNIRGIAVGEWHRTTDVPATVDELVTLGTQRMDRLVGKITDPSSTWRTMWSPSRVVSRVKKIFSSLGTILGLDRRILPMPGDPERQTDPNAPVQAPTFWERILYRLRL